MSQVTHCPSCHTAFKVTSEQLAMSEGWVRCGRCSEVFDALEQIEDWQEPAPPVSTVSPPAVPAKAKVSAPSPISRTEELAAIFGGHSDPETATPPGPLLPKQEPIGFLSGLAEPAEAVAPVPPTPPSQHMRTAEPAQKTEPVFRSRSMSEGDSLPPALAGLRSASAAMAEAQAQRNRSVWSVVWWGGVACVLLLALVWHAVYIWRDQVVQQWPDSRPWVERLCAVQGCTLGASRSLEHLQIDQAALSRRPPQRMSFDFVLRNTSAYSAAAPALELSLLGAGDELLSRRVIQANEWPNARSTIDGHGTWPVRIEFDWAEETGTVTGYRALLFYP